MDDHIIAIASMVVGLLANGMVAMLFQRLKRMDDDIVSLRTEIKEVRINYLNRFQDVKDHATLLHLQTIEKISILDRGLAAHYAASQARENINKERDKEHDPN